MKEYNYDKTEEIYTCKACGYVYSENYMSHERTQGDEPFLALGTTIKQTRGYYGQVEEARLYACPICGTVFVEI